MPTSPSNEILIKVESAIGAVKDNPTELDTKLTELSETYSPAIIMTALKAHRFEPKLITHSEGTTIIVRMPNELVRDYNFPTR